MAAGLGSRREARGQFLLGQVFPLTYLILLFLPKMPDISKQAIQTAGTGKTPAYKQVHLAALGDRVLQCTAPCSPINHSVFAQEGLPRCHTAQEPCPASQSTRQPRWGSEPRMELWVGGGWGSSGWIPPATLASPWADQVIYYRQQILHSRAKTFSKLFPTCFRCWSLWKQHTSCWS